MRTARRFERGMVMLGAILGLALASDARTSRPAPKGSAPSTQSFLRDAAADGMAEVELGKLATANAANQDVKAFGQRMVTDHGKANETLRGIAEKKNVSLPTALDAKHRNAQQRLSKMTGAAFDKAYMDEMAGGHVHAVDAFEKASRSGDADVASFASQTLPTLQEHLQEARRLQATTSGTPSARNAASATPRPEDAPGRTP